MRYFAAAILCCISASAQAPVPQPADDPAPSVKPEDKCSVEGVVVSAITGELLKKARLSLRPIGQQNGTPYRAATDAAGHFLFDAVDPGRYYFFATRNGYLQQSYSAKGNARQNTQLTLDKGQKLKEIVFKLTPQGAISGRILDEDGEPLPNVYVMLGRLEYRRGKRNVQGSQGTRTNDLGEYRVYGLSPGTYVISAKPLDIPSQPAAKPAKAVQAAEEAVVTTFYPGATSLDGASLVEVAAGAQIAGINVTLSRASAISVRGRVITATPRQWEETRVMLWQPKGFGTSLESPIDAKGRFVVHGVTPGSYVLSAVYTDETKPYSAQIALEAASSNIEGIELTLQPPVEVHGHVIVEANGDLKATAVYLLLEPKDIGSPFFRETSARVGEDLSFKISNAALDFYDLHVYGLPESFYLKAVRIGPTDVTETGIDLTQGVAPEELTVVLNPKGGVIEGSVKNAKDDPAPGATVTLIPDASHRSMMWLYQTANTDQNGRFVIKGIRPGDYRIYAWEEMEQDAYQDPDFVKLHESAGETVSIKEGARETVQLKAIPSETTASQKPDR